MPLPKKQPNNKKARKLEKRREQRLNSNPIPSVKFERATYDTNYTSYTSYPNYTTSSNHSKRLYGGTILDLTGKTIPEITGMDVLAADRWQELLPPYDHLTPEDHDWHDPFHHAVASLFHKGGKLKDYGIIPKEGYDLYKIMSYMRAVLPDWGPKHEHKIGGVAHMLRKWCIYDKGQANERP
jgi:hypothetical protein